jgi:beta-lactamase class C
MRLSYLLIIMLFITTCRSKTADMSQKINKNQLVKKDTSALSIFRGECAYVRSFEEFVRETMKETGIPGAAIAIVKDNEILLLKGYGVKISGSADSVDIHTVFRLASTSKGFASVLAGILVQDSLFGWDDLVQKYLPRFTLKKPDNSRHLTIRHILSHTSGLPVHTFTNMIENDIPYSTLRDNLCTVDCVAPAGSVYAYQNVVFSLIGDIVQTITKKSYEEQLHEKIFGPLHMTDASATFKELMETKNMAQPHVKRGDMIYKVVENTHHYYSVIPAAGVNASISDMAQWLFALVGNRKEVIRQATLDDIYKPEVKTPRQRKYEFFHWPQMRNASYGLGWRILDYGGDTIIYHGGCVRGYRSEVAVYPKDKVGIAILVNTTGKLANDGVKIFLDKYFAYVKSVK